jgi:pseudaminic acid cytidylyltransferase
MNNRTIAIIPARGGSKRIPRKNINSFLGKPIIAYSIEVALQSGLFDEVMVSTDDEEIAGIAKSYGAAVPFMRSAENSNDFATTRAVILEVLKRYAEDYNRPFQYACCIYPTSPLTQVAQLQEGFTLLKEQRYTSVSPVVQFDYPIWRGLSIGEHGKGSMIWPEHLYSRSQDLQPVYHDAGQWYWYTTALYNEWVWPDNTGFITLSKEEVQDIDSLSDWKIAEMKYKLLKGKLD